jgi:hypothetical protein
MRRGFLVVLAMVALIWAASASAKVGILGVTAPASAGSDATTADSSIAYKLAFIDCRGCNPSASRVLPYRRVLYLVQPKCRESLTRLADMSVASTRILREDYYIRWTNLQMLRAVNTSIPSGMRTRCADIFAALVVLAGNG